MEKRILIDSLCRSASELVQEERLIVFSGINRSRGHFIIIRKRMPAVTFAKLRPVSERGNRNVGDDALQLGGFAGYAINLLHRNFECSAGVRGIVMTMQKFAESYQSLYRSFSESARVSYDHS